ncbi:hypothetical protein ACFQX7_27090 [Luedemannella flava]
MKNMTVQISESHDVGFLELRQERMTTKSPVSPAAAGGVGTIYEYRVAAIALTYLLSGTHPPGLQMPLVGVALQQRALGHLLDDVVLTAEPGPSPLCTEYQVKHTLSVTASDSPFVDVVVQDYTSFATEPTT